VSTPFWWQDQVTVPFGPPGEMGVDFGTPFHTPVTSLLGGTVTAAGAHPWGEEVQIDTGHGVTEYMRHLDTIEVKVGDKVSAYQEVGLSGGQLSGGSNPVQNPPGTQMYSSGPHTEYGLMGAGGSPINPGSVLAAADPLKAASAAAAKARGLTTPNQQLGGPDNPLPSLPGFPDIGKAILDSAHAAEGWFTDSLWPSLKGNIVPLVVAAAILVVLFGAGGSQPAAAPAPKPVMVPV
jgi:murein DD-endopeptidase MepM/ murein hydrolase activator NlpD